MRVSLSLFEGFFCPRDDVCFVVVDLCDLFEGGAGLIEAGLVTGGANCEGRGGLLGAFGDGVDFHFSLSEDRIKLGDVGDGAIVAGGTGLGRELSPANGCGLFFSCEGLVDDGSGPGDVGGLGELVRESDGFLEVLTREIPENGIAQQGEGCC